MHTDNQKLCVYQWLEWDIMRNLSEKLSQIKEMSFKAIKGTQKLHQVTTTDNVDSILIRHFICFCPFCHNVDHENCVVRNQTSESYAMVEDCQELINYRLHKFVKEINESDDESDNSEEDFVEAESELYMVSYIIQY